MDRRWWIKKNLILSHATSCDFSVSQMIFSFSTRKRRYFTIGNHRVLWTCFFSMTNIVEKSLAFFCCKESLSSSRRIRSRPIKDGDLHHFASQFQNRSTTVFKPFFQTSSKIQGAIQKCSSKVLQGPPRSSKVLRGPPRSSKVLQGPPRSSKVLQGPPIFN